MDYLETLFQEKTLRHIVSTIGDALVILINTAAQHSHYYHHVFATLAVNVIESACQ